ncbi:(2Fe-2S)-binding protein [Neotabrizicola sp. VNH66]|uniref:(2Fe-2S)-binding protein n=1 Tax=Neotabrizicola sp. VNH66 TaxID=3400918 RepID=UPI003C0D8496
MVAPSPILRRAVADTPALTVTVDGVPVTVHAGDTVATAVLLAGSQPYRRTLIGSAPRSPFCMMGVCFDCLVEIDGVANRQGCLIPVRDGMRIRRQTGLSGEESVQ